MYDDSQTRFIVTSENDMLYVNTKDGKYVDLDKEEGLQAIEDIFYHDDKFFILANKKNQKLGFYLVVFDCNNPDKKCEVLVAWNHMLDIGNADI